MKRPWFKTEPVDEAFFDSAPVILREAFDVPLPASRVWSELTADNPLSWCRILQRITWTSAPPYGVGTTREARALGGLNVLRERFFRWEDGARQSFYAVEVSVPGFERFAEDYLVEPTSESACRFTWTIAIESKPAARIGDPGTRALPADTLHRYAQALRGGCLIAALRPVHGHAEHHERDPGQVE